MPAPVYALIVALFLPLSTVAAQRPMLRDASGSRQVMISGVEEVLDPIHWLLVSEDGTMYFPGDDQVAVRRFSRDGVELSGFGRRGSGPGEIRVADWAGWVEDKIWINDSRQRRTVFFDAHGGYISQANWPMGSTLAPLRSSRGELVPYPVFPAAWTSLGEFAYLVGAPAGMILDDPSSKTPPDALLVRAVSNTGVEVGRIAFQGRVPAGCSTYLGVRPRGMSVRIPHCPTLLHQASQDGSLYVWLTQSSDDAANGGYRALLLSVTGDTLFDHRVAMTRPRVTPATRDKAKEDLLDFVRRIRKDLEPQARAVGAREYLPAADAVLVGSNGIVWVRTPSERSDRAAWRCHSARSRSAVGVTLPDDFVAKALRGGVMTGVEVSPDGIESVVQYAVGTC